MADMLPLWHLLLNLYVAYEINRLKVQFYFINDYLTLRQHIN